MRRQQGINAAFHAASYMDIQHWGDAARIMGQPFIPSIMMRAMNDGMRFTANYHRQNVQHLMKHMALIATHNHSRPLFASSLIGKVFDQMDQEGIGLDFQALHNAKDFLVLVSAAQIPKGLSQWQLSEEHERIFSNQPGVAPNILPITRDAVLASCALRELVPGVKIGNETMWDGGYIANPNLKLLAEHCIKHEAELVIIRTRPTKAFIHILLDGEDPKTDEEQAAYFNNRLNRDIEEVRRVYPGLTIHIVEPDYLERFDRKYGQKPECDFRVDSLDRRYQDGELAGKKLCEALNISSNITNGFNSSVRRSAPMPV